MNIQHRTPNIQRPSGDLRLSMLDILGTGYRSDLTRDWETRISRNNQNCVESKNTFFNQKGLIS